MNQANKYRRLKVVNIVLLAVAVVAIVIAISLTTMSSNNYKLSYVLKVDGTYEVAWYSGEVQNLEIPSEHKGVPVTSIAESGFKDCKSLRSVIVPDSVTTIGSAAFSGCSALRSITLPFVGGSSTATESSRTTCLGYIFGTEEYEGGTAIRQFYASLSAYVVYCVPSKLESVTITGGNIFFGSFYNCSSLTSIIISDSVTLIGDSAFYGCSSITSVIIPNSVTSIGSRAFENCSSITSIVIPDSVTSIGYSAFYGCSSLAAVYYTGCSSDWSGIFIGSSNSPLASATMYFYSETEPDYDDEYSYWHYVDGEPVVWASFSSKSVSFSDMTDADALALYEAIKSLCGYEGSYTVKNTNQNTYDSFIRDDDGKYCETGFLSEYYIYSYDKESGYLAYEYSSQDLWCYDDEVLEDSLWINNEYYVPMGDGILYVYTYTYDSEDDVEPEMTVICTTDSYSSYRRQIGIVTDYLGEYMYYVMDENEWMTVDDAEDFMLNYMLDSDVFDDDDLFSNFTTAMQVSESDGETIYKLSVIFRYGDYNGTGSDWAYMMTCDFIFFVDENDVMTGFLYFQDYNCKGLYDDEYEEGRSVYYEYYEISYEFDESYRLSDENAAQYEPSA